MVTTRWRQYKEKYRILKKKIAVSCSVQLTRIFIKKEEKCKNLKLASFFGTKLICSRLNILHASKQNCTDKLQMSNENATQSHIHCLCHVFFSVMEIHRQHCIIHY